MIAISVTHISFNSFGRIHIHTWKWLHCNEVNKKTLIAKLLLWIGILDWTVMVTSLLGGPANDHWLTIMSLESSGLLVGLEGSNVSTVKPKQRQIISNYTLNCSSTVHTHTGVPSREIGSKGCKISMPKPEIRTMKVPSVKTAYSQVDIPPLSTYCISGSFSYNLPLWQNTYLNLNVYKKPQ